MEVSRAGDKAKPTSPKPDGYTIEAMETPTTHHAHRHGRRQAQGAARRPARTPPTGAARRRQGGGCSGFQYALALDKRKEDDHVFKHQGVSVVVDKVSMQFVFGSEVDYVDGLQGAGFTVNNPNVVAACGCGSSFQVKDDAAEQAATVWKLFSSAAATPADRAASRASAIVW